MTRNATPENVEAYLRQRREGKSFVAFGVDPGAGNTGWAAILWPVRRIVALGTLHGGTDATCEALLAIAREHSPRLIAVQVPAVEGQRAPVWNRSAMALVRNGILAGTIYGRLAWTFPATPCVAVPPRPYAGLKQDARTWAIAWDYTGRCSEHARDAAVIASMGCQEGKR